MLISSLVLHSPLRRRRPSLSFPVSRRRCRRGRVRRQHHGRRRRQAGGSLHFRSGRVVWRHYALKGFNEDFRVPSRFYRTGKRKLTLWTSKHSTTLAENLQGQRGKASGWLHEIKPAKLPSCCCCCCCCRRRKLCCCLWDIPRAVEDGTRDGGGGGGGAIADAMEDEVTPVVESSVVHED